MAVIEQTTRHDHFHDAIDVGGNLRKAMAAVDHLYGLPALFVLIMAGTLTVVCAAASWYFDLDSTAHTLAPQFAKVLKATDWDPTMIGYVASLATLLPTFIAFVSGGLSKQQHRWAQMLLYAVLVFDCFTDWPHVVEFCQDSRPEGGINLILWYVWRIGMLGMAVMGWEMLTVTFALMTLALFFRVGAKRKV
jgi:cellulose synthase/poly-beta-1,6-N-acetylglucosamine synthase-like glycosyltransferase